MSHGTTASLICPACGQPFLSMQHVMEGVTQCPHCAHSSSRSHFITHGQTAGLAQVRRRVAQSQPLQNATAPMPQQHLPDPAPQPTAWPGMPQQQPTPAASIARATLQPSQALLPVGEPPPPMEFTVPSQMRGSSWKHAFIMLAFCVVCGAAVWVWWDHANASAAVLKQESSKPQPPTEIRPAQVATKPQPATPMVPPPDVAAIAADAKTLVTELFAADSPERRAACIHDAEKHMADVEAMLGPNAAEKIELRLLARIPGLPLTLPGGQPVPLFKLVTSKCANGALVRLETGADGKRRIHWPMLFETHEGRLDAFLKQGATADAAWFHVAMRPSHGLDIPAELRPKYLTFDAQTAATSDPHFVACVERDTPLGRFLDRESEWGKVYVARLFVRRLDVKADALCMVVVDCEGALER